MNDVLFSLFEIDPSDIPVNSSGGLTPHQEEKLALLRKRQECSSVAASLAFLFSAGLVIAVFMNSVERGSAAFSQSIAYIAGTMVVFLLIAGGFIYLGWRRTADVRSGIVSITEGEVALSEQRTRYGTAYFASVGEVKFYLSASEQYSVLYSYTFLNVYYVKKPPVHVILSLEVMG